MPLLPIAGGIMVSGVTGKSVVLTFMDKMI